jgi:hypothetical protein
MLGVDRVMLNEASEQLVLPSGGSSEKCLLDFQRLSFWAAGRVFAVSSRLQVGQVSRSVSTSGGRRIAI